MGRLSIFLTSHYDRLTPLQRTLLAERLSKADKHPSGCWLMPGVALHSGHVQFSIGSAHTGVVRVRAHVFAWELAHQQSVPAGHVVMHACDVPRCVNPAHLSVGTQRDNVLDSIRKGRYNVFGHQKLNAEQVREIRARAAKGERQIDIARDYGIARNTVSGIVTGASWGHLDSASPSQSQEGQ